MRVSDGYLPASKSKSHNRFLKPWSRAAVLLAYRCFRRRASWCVNHESERQSPGGSAAFSCHCTQRWVLVNEPSISATCAEGNKNTSVLMSSLLTSPFFTSGAAYQKDAVSVSKLSLTT